MKSTSLENSPENPVSLENFLLKQLFTDALPGEQSPSNYPHEVPDTLWSPVQPVPAVDPVLIAWSTEMADLLGIDIEQNPRKSAQIFTGTKTPQGSIPYAMRYGGHQFGNWAGQLGDGRAIALGEVTDLKQQNWTLQLKGAGPTPFSRQGDGFAVLRSSVREYLCSEAMHHLGIPTTRSLTLCLTGNKVERDIFYDGNIQTEAGAILCRAAHSFVRFGSFEIHAAYKEHDHLKNLANYIIKNNYSQLWPKDGKPTVDTYQRWFAELLERTANLMVQWQRVGFVHAVMNTDNMSILGQTIDYGPYGWLEEYDPKWTPSFIDQQGRRYCYENQPQIALWNLYRLANAVLPLFNDDTQPLRETLETYNDIYTDNWNNTSAAKIGIDQFDSNRGDNELLDKLWTTLQATRTDFTVFFRSLAKINLVEKPDTGSMFGTISDAFYEPDKITPETREQFTLWLDQWSQRVAISDDEQRQTLMNHINPKYVLRNYVAQMAIDAAEEGDYSVLEELAVVLKKPYDEQPGFEKYAGPRPDWATQRAGATMLTCSS